MTNGLLVLTKWLMALAVFTLAVGIVAILK